MIRTICGAVLIALGTGQVLAGDCPDIPQQVLWAYRDGGDEQDPDQVLWPGLIPDEEVDLYGTFVIAEGADIDVELLRVNQLEDPLNGEVEVIATGWIEVLAAYNDETGYAEDEAEAILKTVAGIMHVDGNDQSRIVTGKVIEFDYQGEMLATSFAPILFPDNVSTAAWEACFLSKDPPPLPVTGKGQEPVPNQKLALAYGPAAEVGPAGDGRAPGYCARVALKMCRAAYRRYRAALKRCAGNMLAFGLGGLVACGSTGPVGVFPCAIIVVGGADVYQKFCNSAAYDVLVAELAQADIWAMECCQEHDCPGYVWP